MGSSLKSFIKDVRAAKTLAEERSIITKQSAKIRTKLRDDHISLERKRRYIQKLLYLYILGEKTHFGQVECINLIASDEFVNKRLGYLGATLLLDESHDLLTLLTNLLNSDLNHKSKFIVSLALNTLGSLCNAELARDLFPAVNNLLATSKEPLLVKKALQCAAKMISKDESLLDVLDVKSVHRAVEDTALSTHGVLLSACKVVQSAILHMSAYKQANDYSDDSDEIVVMWQSLQSIVSLLISNLERLSKKEYRPDYDVQGVCDPFLQCEILYTARLFFQNDPFEDLKNKDLFNDLMTYIATYTDASKSSGLSVLYETARTIFALQLDQSMRVLGVNILAKFLSSKTNNVRYVALSTLLKVVPQEPAAVQRHRKFISRCLYDSDISIKMRALDLMFAILDHSNMVELVEQLLKFLESTSKDERELIKYTVDHLIAAFDLNADVDNKWRLQVFLRLLKVGPYMTLDNIGDILITINNTLESTDKHNAISSLVRKSLDPEQPPSIEDENLGWHLVTIWCIGEYGEVILAGNADKLVNEDTLTTYLKNMDSEYISDDKIVAYILTAALKLSVKISNNYNVEKLRQIILSHNKDTNILIQLKSEQYEIFFRQPESTKRAILEAMPKFEKKVESSVQQVPIKSKIISKPKQENDFLVDLLSDITSTPHATPSVPASVPTSKPHLLEDIFGTSGEGTAVPAVSAPQIVIPENAVQLHESTFFTAYAHVVSVSAGSAQVDLFIKSKRDITDLGSLCAVTKTQKLTLGSLHPSNSLGKEQVCKQMLKITGSGKLKLRVKLNFNIEGTTASEQFDHKFDQSI